MSNDNDQSNLSGGRSLGGGPAEPLPEGWAGRTGSAPRVGRVGGPSTSRPARSTGDRIATLRDIAASGPPPGPPPPAHGAPGHSHDDDDDDDEDEPQRWFAGGERSGLSIENPDRAPRGSGNNVVRDILRKAAEATRREAPPAGGSGSSVFAGSGHTLGSDEVPSSFIPDPNAPEASDAQEETAVRNITFWRDGFSVEDGPLMSYDDPEHANLLNEIDSGHAPPSILNVRVGQPVELRVARRLHEDYVAAPVRTGPFMGQGNRLGSPAAEVVPSTGATGSIPGAFPLSAQERVVEAGSVQTRFEVDQTLPTTSVQVRLADGTRIVSRMNLTHTVGDIRNFINASRPGSSARPYIIQTTFPNRVLEDNSATVESAGLLNSVIVQRWV